MENRAELLLPTPKGLAKVTRREIKSSSEMLRKRSKEEHMLLPICELGIWKEVENVND